MPCTGEVIGFCLIIDLVRYGIYVMQMELGTLKGWMGGGREEKGGGGGGKLFVIIQKRYITRGRFHKELGLVLS